MLFSIVTPSFKQLDWLRLAVASIRDQVEENAEGGKLKPESSSSLKPSGLKSQVSRTPLAVEHIIQDAGTPGIEEFARDVGADFYRDGAPIFKSQVSDFNVSNYRIAIFSERDNGMYDAVNRGYGKAAGEIFAYLNCDEQYLPGALEQVAEFFSAQPGKEVVFGDAIVVDSAGSYMCHRRGLPPQAAHTLVSENLSFSTASAFLMASVFRDRRLCFDTKWRDVGDAAWAYSLCQAAVNMASLGIPTTAFTDTGDNMNIRPNALHEKKLMREGAPRWMQKSRSLIILHYRLRKALSGAYSIRPGSYHIFTREHPDRRQEFHFEKPTHRWVGR